MLQLLSSPLSTSAPTSHSCTIGFEGGSIGITSFNLLAPAKTACKPKWLPYVASQPLYFPNTTEAGHRVETTAACRATFNSASKPKYFDGTEHDALSTDDAPYAGTPIILTVGVGLAHPSHPHPILIILSGLST